MDLEKVGEEGASGRRLGLEAKHAAKNLAARVLTKLYHTHELFQAYQQEKQRLARTAFIQYSVAAVSSLALLVSAAALLRHTVRARKWDTLASSDEEALVCE
jgi:hypothetical protein